MFEVVKWTRYLFMTINETLTKLHLVVD